MTGTAEESARLAQQGVEALRLGRAWDARTTFERLTQDEPASALHWLLLAMSCHAAGDLPSEEDALNRLLEIDPQSIRGNVMKGECRAAAKDDVPALYFYKRALRIASGAPIPQEFVSDVQRAERMTAELEARAHAQRESRLNARGLPQDQWSPRFRQSLELAAGRKTLFPQAPTAFYYPELPHIQFFDPAQFEWAAALEASAGVIREELLTLLKDGTDDFRPYIEAHTNAVPMLGENKTLLSNRDWSALFLCENGWMVPKVVERCPRTWEAVLRTPMPRVPGWGPTAMFSLLKAGARIAAHTGMFNTRLVCHLPLIVPPNCRFRVGNDVREWEEGKLMIFDDTIEHEAWNDSDQDRVVLIFDIWRPELSERERRELTALFSD